MSFISEIAEKIPKNEYFIDLLKKAEVNSAKAFFQLEFNILREKEYIDLLRFADILSRSRDEKHHNTAYRIVSLLAKSHSENSIFQVFSKNILIKTGNFPAIKFLEKNSNNNALPLEIRLERAVKEVVQEVPNSGLIFTDSQYRIFELLKNNNHFSFSGPTSLGKSFVINAFIHFLIKEHKGRDNIAILVPTRALINQTVRTLKAELKQQKEKRYKVLSHPTIPEFFRQDENQFIFVFTPERLVSYLSEADPLKIDYLFIDEAQKILGHKDTRSPLYYHSIFLAERKSVRLFFSSPNIPNPEIFLKLFDKSTSENLRVRESPVAQNRYYLDFIDQKCLVFLEEGDTVQLPFEFKDRDFFYWLKKLNSDDKSIIYCNTKEDTVSLALEFAKTLPIKKDAQINEVIEIVRDYLHKDYFLINCLQKGVGFHFGSLPQRIREKVEELFKKKAIDYVFCTSTLLEGVNLPAKNIFILSNAVGLTKFTEIDFWNLAGRAGRLAKELAGNIICARIIDKRNRWQNPKDLDVVRNKELKPATALMINGNKKFFENLENSIEQRDFTNKSASDAQKKVWDHYANITLLHEIKREQSVLKSNFLKKNTKRERTLDKAIKQNKVPEPILEASTTIKNIYQNKILKVKALDQYILPQEVTFQSCLKQLTLLCDFYRWDIEEDGGRNPMYKGKNSLRYYAMLMNTWINSTPINLMITRAIKYYSEELGYFISKGEEIEFDRRNPEHINHVINELITNIDNILRFKLKMYFKNFYQLLVHSLGEENSGSDWSEFLEYGTINHKVIELQNIGLPRHLAIFVLEHYPDTLQFESNKLVKFDYKKILSREEGEKKDYCELIELIDEGF